jgi:hypothetical protein
LNSFHSGGSLGGRSAKGFPRVNELLTLPENVRNKAIISKAEGVVNAVDRSTKGTGGYEVTVGGIKHYIPQELQIDPTLRIGVKVKAGQKLSLYGSLRPQDLLEATGDMGKVRDAIIDELNDNFSSSGVKIKRRIYETVIKPMTDSAKVTDPGTAISKGVSTGDIMSLNRIEEMNRSEIRPIQFEPLLHGVTKVPHFNKDFVGRLMHDRLKDTLKDSVALGLESRFGPGGHPISRIAYSGVGRRSLPSKS